jgi:hypothetical protein
MREQIAMPRSKTKSHPQDFHRSSGSDSQSLTRPLSSQSLSFSRLAKDLPSIPAKSGSNQTL